MFLKSLVEKWWKSGWMEPFSLPSAETMQSYDTLEIDVRMECPDPEKGENWYQGPWDYLAHMWLYDDATEEWLEMARFITTYHRESRWVVDATHALAWLQEGEVDPFAMNGLQSGIPNQQE